MPRVSIIVPVFNEETRIKQCINSIQDQTLNDIEIIVVNDGSTDGTLKILEQLAESDVRVKIFNFSNGGTGFALNKGLQLATGKYVGFSGADDWTEPVMFEELVTTLEHDETDMVVCDIRKEYNQISQNVLGITAPTIISEQLLEKCLLMEFDYSICNKLYKREILLKNNISFAEDLRISQDALFNFYVFACIKSVSVIPGAFYHYVAKEGSLMSSPQDKRIASFNYIITAFRKFCSENNKPEAWRAFEKYIGPGYQKYLFNLVLTSSETGKMGFKEYYEHILRHLRLMDPLLLYAPLHKESRYQKFRKGLLQKKRFKIFSLLTAIRHKTL
jgi:glycosyltransferase EpsH